MTVTTSLDLPGSCVVTDYNIMSPQKTSFAGGHLADSNGNLNDSTSQLESRSIAEKMHIYSQMQAQPFLDEALLGSIEQLEPGMAFTYLKRRVSEVNKISEVGSIWTFLTTYMAESSPGCTLSIEQV